MQFERFLTVALEAHVWEGSFLVTLVSVCEVLGVGPRVLPIHARQVLYS